MSVAAGSPRSAVTVAIDRGREMPGIAHLPLHWRRVHFQTRQNRQDGETENISIHVIRLSGRRDSLHCQPWTRTSYGSL